MRGREVLVGSVPIFLLVAACGSNGPGGTPPGGGGDAGTAGAADAAGAGDAVVIRVAWDNAGRQAPAWYATAEAAALADAVIYYQNDDGGWPKNIDPGARLAPKDRSTIDNSATTSQLVFLSLIYNATQTPAYLDSFNKGIDYLLGAQYPDNGGWPQTYPSPSASYQKHITFNDGAMVKVLTVLRNVTILPQYAFVDEDRKTKAAAAVEAGIDCILKTQIVVDDVKTGWCAQHDEVTLAPVNARAYELASNSGSEAAGVLQFLMNLNQPTPEIVAAVQAATAWFAKVQLHGIRVQDIDDATQTSGKDKVVVPDPAAPAIWARFYEIGTDAPIFSGRDGIKKYALAEIENERRTGYAWYGDWPLARVDYYNRTWQPRWAPELNVLAKPGNADGGAGASDAGADDGMP